MGDEVRGKSEPRDQKFGMKFGFPGGKTLDFFRKRRKSGRAGVLKTLSERDSLCLLMGNRH